jgi:hypothetical protein
MPSARTAAVVRRCFVPLHSVLTLVAALAVAKTGTAGPPPVPAATLSQSTVPAAGRQEAIVNVAAFGFYGLTVSSSQGTALQLVDRMAGPGEVAGSAGVEDGRINAFLDRGEYKLVSIGHEKASGDAKLEVHPYAELHAPQPPLLVELKPVAETLGDFQQASYWLKIDDARVVAIEAAGRNLTDLRLWRDGTWLEDATPEREVIEPKKGRPLLACRLSPRLEPGLYLLTAYGGPGQPWAETSDEHPLLLRFGISRLPIASRQRLVTSPFGVDRFLVPGSATYFRLELPEARPAQLRVAAADPHEPFRNDGSPLVIDKKSVPPAVDTSLEKDLKGDRIVTVRTEAGQPYVLQEFEASREYRFERAGNYWISTVHSGHAADSVDATVIVARWSRSGLDHAAFLDQSVEIDGQHGWARRCTLLDTLTVFVKVGSVGRYEVVSRGTKASFRIEPFFIYRPEHYETPEAKPSGSRWDLDAGFYVLTVIPDKKGILDVVLRPAGTSALTPEGIGAEPAGGQTPLRAAALFPSVALDLDHWYVAYLNEQPGVEAGVVLRSLPLDLNEALPVAQRPDETVKAPFTVSERSTLRATSEDGALLDLAVDGGPPQKEIVVEPGEHVVSLVNSGKETVLYSLHAEPVRLEAATPLPSVPETALASLPELLVLAPAQPIFLDLARDQTTTFFVHADRPALYRLESTGLLATTGNLRTRTVVSLDRETSNGVGRNFQIQEYLREGDYQLTVQANGASAGHLGVGLAQMPIGDGGRLVPSVPARVTLAAGEGVAYTFTVPERGEYHLRTLGLDRGFRCRLEDADGWPIEPPNIPADITRTFEAGSYRVVSLPEGVATRRVTLLEKVAAPLRFTGHGPHPLPLAHEVDHVWEESAEGAPRVPDTWEITVPAPLDAQIELSGEMQGELTRVDASGAAPAVAVPPGRGWFGHLEAGRYRLAVTCSRRNNQVGYRIVVRPVELVAGLTREVAAPVTLKVSAGRRGLYELDSFGGADVRAVLRAGDGRVVAANDDRPDDWNFLLAANLDPGAYTLEVQPVGTERASSAVSMRLLGELAEPPLAVPGRVEVVTGDATHVIPLALGSPVGVVTVGVRSSEAVGCALEQEGGGSWRALATRVGHELTIELPLAESAPPPALRLRVWSVDQRGLSARIVAAAASPAADPEARANAGLVLTRVAGSDPPVGAALVTLAQPGVFRIDGEGIRVSPRADVATTAVTGEPVAAPGQSLWVVGELHDGGRTAVRLSRVVLEAGGEVVVRAAAGQHLTCQVGGEGPRTVLGIARGANGRPGVRVLDRATGKGYVGSRTTRMAVGRDAAASVAIGARQPEVQLWQGEEAVEPLEVHLRVFTFPAANTEVAAWGLLSGAVAAHASRAFELPPGPKRLRLALAPDTVGVLVSGDDVESLHWAGGSPFAETFDTEASRLVVLRAADGEGFFTAELLRPGAGERPLALTLEQPFESVESVAGTLRLTVPHPGGGAPESLVAHVRGGEATFLGSDGQVREGRDVAVGADGGTLLVSHRAGRLLCWLDRKGGLADALWAPVNGATAAPIEPPATVALHGSAMVVRVALGHPAMLHLRSATPLATRLVRPEGDPEVELHQNGCLLDAYLPSGAAELALRALAGTELRGVAELTASPLVAIDEGFGPETLLPAGEARAFTFTVSHEGLVGFGVRADADVVECTLLDASARRVAAGVVQMASLTPGTYVLVLSAPADVAPVRVRPVVVGLRSPGSGPPPEVIRKYLDLAAGKAAGSPSAASGARAEEPPGTDEEQEDEPPDGGER